MTHCKNCYNQFEGKFCNICGQKSGVRRLDWHFVIENIQHTIFHLDYGMLYTIRQLFTKPGIVAREYVAGKRVRYTPPLTYLIIISLGYYFLQKFVMPSQTTVYSSKQMELMFGFIQSYYDKILMLVLVPLSVIFTKWLFPKKHYNFFELFAFYCYVYGQFLLIASAVQLLDLLLVQFEIFLHPLTLLALTLFSNTLFMSWGLWQFYGSRNFFISLLKSLMIVILLFISAFVMLVIASMIMTGNGIK